MFLYHCPRPRLSPVQERNQARAHAERGDRHRHREGAIRPCFPQAAQHGDAREAGQKDLHQGSSNGNIL